MVYPKVTVAAVQSAPVYLNRDATVDKACRVIDEAASRGAKVIGFPESYVPGYPWWIWMGSPNEGMPHYIRLYQNAVEIPSPAVSRLSDAAKRNKVYVCISVTEKDGMSLYLTQLWFNPQGDLVGKHRKFKCTSAEKTIWGDGDGSMAPIIESEYGNLGGLQCWEHALPLNLAAMSSLNEQIHVSSWPSFLPGDGDLFGIECCELMAKYYAVSNQVYCIMTSHIYTDEMREMICNTDAQREMMQNGYGCTEIIAPNAKVLAKVPRDEEGLAIAEIDLSAQIPGKFLTDPAGHYSTPGFLSLTFDRNEHKPVRQVGREPDFSLSWDELHADSDQQ